MRARATFASILLGLALSSFGCAGLESVDDDRSRTELPPPDLPTGSAEPGFDGVRAPQPGDATFGGAPENDDDPAVPALADNGGQTLSAIARGACFDGLDNEAPVFVPLDASGDPLPEPAGGYETGEEDEAIDCASSACRFAPVCRVGSTDNCPVATDQLLNSMSCAEGLTGCTAVSTFGKLDAQPRIEDGHYIPGGDAQGSSGLFFGDTLSSRLTQVVLSTTLVTPVCSDDGCISSAFVGLTRATPQDELTGVTPSIAFGVTSSPLRGLVLVEGEVVDTFEWSDELTERQMSLEVSPDGSFKLLDSTVRDRDGRLVELASGTHAPADDLRTVLFGRSINPGFDDVPAGATWVSVRSRTCDRPNAWSSPSVLADTEGRGLRALESPTFITPDLILGYVNGETRLIELSSARMRVLRSDGYLSQFDYDAAGQQLFAVQDNDEGRQIVVLAAMGGDFETFALAEPEPIVINTEDRVDQPSAITIDNVGTVLAVRAERDIKLFFRASDVNEFTATGAVFTAEEQLVESISNPSLMHYGGGWHLHFQAREGTRVAVRSTLSENLNYWSSLGQVYAGGSPSDRFGARVEDVMHHDHDVLMLYTGEDGVGESAALIRRTVR